jgi:hormone-sensitive lipase
MHGGGWVAMSSYSHQIYTRDWANSIKNSIIFSVDYGKTPDHPYPDALNECWQAYIWVQLHSE